MTWRRVVSFSRFSNKRNIRSHPQGEVSPQTQTSNSIPLPQEGFGKSFSKALEIQYPLERDQALAALLRRWAESNPQEALEVARNLVSTELRDQAIRQLTQDWASQAPEHAAQWALAIPDSTERSRIMDFVCSKIALLQPLRALELMKNALDKAQPASIGNLVQQWASEDLSAAYAWANALAPGNPRQEALRRISFIWSKTDP